MSVRQRPNATGPAGITDPRMTATAYRQDTYQQHQHQHRTIRVGRSTVPSAESGDSCVDWLITVLILLAVSVTCGVVVFIGQLRGTRWPASVVRTLNALVQAAGAARRKAMSDSSSNTGDSALDTFSRSVEISLSQSFWVAGSVLSVLVVVVLPAMWVYRRYLRRFCRSSNKVLPLDGGVLESEDGEDEQSSHLAFPNGVVGGSFNTNPKSATTTAAATSSDKSE